MTPEEALANLLNSEVSPIDVTDPERLAEIIVQSLRDSGFQIVPADRQLEEGDR